jgi:hypothetical protein
MPDAKPHRRLPARSARLAIPLAGEQTGEPGHVAIDVEE